MRRNPVTGANAELDFTPSCGALSAVLVIGGLTLIGMITFVVVMFSVLRRIVNTR